MNAPGPIYDTEMVCPVCEVKFPVTKVRSRSVKLLKQDSDFCPHYEGINPLFYEVIVCPDCGFASHITTAGSINRFEKQKVKELITNKWSQRDFSGERSWAKALEAFKIALLNLNCREAYKSEIAKICIRIAWLYRYANDKELEQRYITHALNNYKAAFEGENLSESKMDEFVCMFIIGELSRRTGLFEQSQQWFSRLISSYADPKNKSKIPQSLIETTRDLVHEMKQQNKNAEAV